MAVVIRRGDFYWDDPNKDEIEKNDDQSIGEISGISNHYNKENGIKDSFLPVEEGNKFDNTEKHITIKNINLDIKKGELVVIIGGNSSGKSTLIYSILSETKYSNEDTYVWKAS